MNIYGCYLQTDSIVHTEWSPRHLVVHDNLQMFTKYSERSVHNLQGLPHLSVLCALMHCTI